jgi:hypothetical protein
LLCVCTESRRNETNVKLGPVDGSRNKSDVLCILFDHSDIRYGRRFVVLLPLLQQAEHARLGDRTFRKSSDAFAMMVHEAIDEVLDVFLQESKQSAGRIRCELRFVGSMKGERVRRSVPFACNRRARDQPS